jgi:hypothetical protein
MMRMRLINAGVRMAEKKRFVKRRIGGVHGICSDRSGMADRRYLKDDNISSHCADQDMGSASLIENVDGFLNVEDDVGSKDHSQARRCSYRRIPSAEFGIAIPLRLRYMKYLILSKRKIGEGTTV